MSRWLLLLALGSLGLGGAVSAQAPAFRATCAALPPTRPAGLVLRHAVHAYASPSALVRHTFYEASAPCPPDEMPGHMLAAYAPRVCVPLDTGTLDSLYARLLASRIASIRVRAPSPAPHSAGAELTLLWAGQSCRIGDVLHVLEIHPDDAAAFRAIDGALRALEMPPAGGS